MQKHNNTPATQQVKPQDYTKAILQRAVLKQLHEEADALKTHIAATMQPGQSMSAFDEAGVKLGTISKSAGTPKMRVDDLSIILGNANPNTLTPVVDGTDPRVIAIIQEHAPELVQVDLPPYELKRLTDAAQAEFEATGQPPAGWKLEPGSSIVTIRPNKLSQQRAAQLLARTELPAIEAGEDK